MRRDLGKLERDYPAGPEETNCYDVNCLWAGPHGKVHMAATW